MKKLILGMATLIALTFVACEEEIDSTLFSAGFDTNGGSYISSQIIEDGDTIVVPNNPEKQNATFIGWYYNDSAYNFSTPVTEDIILTAQWTVTDGKMKIIDFEGVSLDSTGSYALDTISSSIIANGSSLSYTASNYSGIFYYSGFTISNQDDITTAGYTNPYSCIASSGAYGSSNFAVYNKSRDSIKFNAPIELDNVMLCNNTYAALSMENGDFVAKKFEAGDYFKVFIKPHNAAGEKLGTEEFYLADFRDGKSIIVKEWTKFDLSTYKDVSYIKFGFESTDNGDYGMNTPAYFCIDNISYYETE